MPDYFAVIHKEPDSAYGVSFPDFPGCISAGDTAEEALANADEALALHIEGMLEAGEALPDPRALDDILADPDWNDGALVQVEGPMPKGRAVRIQITIDEHLLAETDRLAGSEGMSRSGLIAHALRFIGRQRASTATGKRARAVRGAP